MASFAAEVLAFAIANWDAFLMALSYFLALFTIDFFSLTAFLRIFFFLAVITAAESFLPDFPEDFLDFLADFFTVLVDFLAFFAFLATFLVFFTYFFAFL